MCPAFWKGVRMHGNRGETRGVVDADRACDASSAEESSNVKNKDGADPRIHVSAQHGHSQTGSVNGSSARTHHTGARPFTLCLRTTLLLSMAAALMGLTPANTLKPALPPHSVVDIDARPAPIEFTAETVSPETGEIQLASGTLDFIPLQASAEALAPGSRLQKQDDGGGDTGGDGGTADTPPAASIDITVECIRDQEALLPLHDWVGLFRFTLSYGAEDYAPRYLSSLRFRVVPDGRDDPPYGILGGPNVSDLLEFGIFGETFADDSDKDGFLNMENDYLIYRWPATGGGPATVTIGTNYTEYVLDFIGSGDCTTPEFPINAGPDSLDLGGYSYIVGVRTSPTWRSMLSMGCQVLGAKMVEQGTCAFYTDDDGLPIDSYSPNFYDGEVTDEESAYSASFSVWDISGPATKNAGASHSWNQYNYYYTPLGEYSRPRWNAFGEIMEAVAGEPLYMRGLLSLETWSPVIGINAHSTPGQHFDGGYSISFDGETISFIREVNVVLTDIGADPYAAPGNGGFDPRSALEHLTSGGVATDSPFGDDEVFNGISLWTDYDNDGVFSPPTSDEGGGVTFDGDYPMNVLSYDFSDGVSWQWNYVPFPPDGGDPWWVISMRFSPYMRSVDNDGGWLERIPDVLDEYDDGGDIASDVSNDFFVVVRPDSGIQDGSLEPGDGVGAQIGADFRAFIEPRRYNPVTGHESGGIYINSQIPLEGDRYDGQILSAWQDDSLWGTVEPWWTQRTVNDRTTRPVRIGLDVHDYALTLRSDSEHLVRSDGPMRVYDNGSSCLGYTSLGVAELSTLDSWVDPFGLLQSRFLNGHTTSRQSFSWRSHTAIANVPVIYDYCGAFHFSYETVPFLQVGLPLMDNRSSAYPMPLDQPALPWRSTWPESIEPGQLPRASDWGDSVGARLLTQKTRINSTPTPLLGLNLAGIGDPYMVTNGQFLNLESITIALWGPDFTPDDLRSLDSVGTQETSGVLLWEDVDGDGVFSALNEVENYLDTGESYTGQDRPVPLQGLAWKSDPEPIDLDGDGIPDDMDGDGIVDSRDYAWVLTLTPQDLWEVPPQDREEVEGDFSYSIWCSLSTASDFSPSRDGGGGSSDGVTEVLIEAERDVTLYQSASGTLANGQGDYLYVGPSPMGKQRRTALYFDIQSNVPEGATIEEAVLWLYVPGEGPTSGKVVYLTPATQIWGEGSSLVEGAAEEGGLAMAGDATWLHRYYPDVYWNTAGGDFVSPDFPSFITGATTILNGGWNYWDDSDLYYTVTAQVQDWLDNPGTNLGWFLLGNEDEVTQYAVSFYSAEFMDEYTEDVYPPYLVISYTEDKKKSGAGAKAQKGLGPVAGTADEWEAQPGDDLFITVTTSSQPKRFEGFRAVIPATLPGRAAGLRDAGIQFAGGIQTAASALTKSSPEEDHVQDYYGNDMLIVNVPAKVVDMTSPSQVIYDDGTPLPVLGIDMSTNDASTTLDSGSDGVGGEGVFAVADVGWTAGAFAGDWLVDADFETFEIESNTADRLFLLSGKPADGAWRVVRDPSFLEQVIVEFYNEYTHADFNPLSDLQPLDQDMELSGVALYRDNDSNPANRNGLFDPDIDIPLTLDAAPEYQSLAGGNMQVKFVFSSPGTDDVPRPIEEQARNRQWVPDDFGSSAKSENAGPEIFVVLRASSEIETDTDFRVGIVAWGPNTPSEPDPDTWAGLSGTARDEFANFEEFPWGSRALGFVTFFKEAPIYYYMDGNRAGQKADNSGLNWIRSHGQQKVRTGIISSRTPATTVYSVVIDSVSNSNLPEQIMPGSSHRFLVYGSGFGSNPEVTLSSYQVDEVLINDEGTTLTVTISTVSGVIPAEPVVLFVRNPDRNKEASRSDLFNIVAGTGDSPLRVTSVSPAQAAKTDFPVTVNGENFSEEDGLAVYFDSTLMPVIEIDPDGTRVVVGYPAGGLSTPGLYDVKVTNATKGTEDILVEGFELLNPANLPKAVGCGTAPESAKTGGPLADALLFLGMVAALFLAVRIGLRREKEATE